MPLTGTILPWSSGRRVEVYPLVAWMTFLHLIEPRAVLTVHVGAPEDACSGVMSLTGVSVCKLTSRVTARSSMWVTSLYGHSRAALYVRQDLDPLTPDTCGLR